MRPRELRFRVALADAGRLWWRNLASFAAIAVVVAVPLGLAELASHELEVTTDLRLALVLGLASLTLAAVGEALCAGLAEHVLHHDRPGEPRPPLWRLARQVRLLTLVALAVIVGAAVAVGALLFLLPGLAGYAWLAVATPVASVERVGPIRALRRSVALVRGRFWRVVALTTATFVPVVAADTVGSVLRAWHSPVWLSIMVEAGCEAIVITMTGAVVVVIYRALRAGGAARPGSERGRPPPDRSTRLG